MLTRWLLKTVAADGAADGDFVWPLEVGAEVTAPDWDPTPVCGGGLHGLLDGRGNGSLINWSTDAVWIVAEIPDDETVVDLDGKVKVRRCIVRHVGDKTSAPEFLAAHGHTEGVVYGTATAGVSGAATAGDYGTATAGVSGTATAGERGTIIIAWWDSELGRRRWVVGEVGIDGIVADTPYRVVDGALVEVES